MELELCQRIAKNLGQRYFLGTSTFQKWLKPFQDGISLHSPDDFHVWAMG